MVRQMSSNTHPDKRIQNQTFKYLFFNKSEIENNRLV